MDWSYRLACQMRIHDLVVAANDVKQGGWNVEFGIRMAHSTFKRSLTRFGADDSEKEINGQWPHRVFKVKGK